MAKQVMPRNELREAIKNLSLTNKKNIESYIEELYKKVVKPLTADSSSTEYNKTANDIFYNSLEKTYSTTSKELNSIYTGVEEFNPKNILDLTYKSDGKTLEDRILSYIEKTISKLKEDPLNESAIKLWLYGKFDALLTNETAIVETAIKKNKIPIKATILVVEGGCTCGDGFCEEQVGEYPADELPPCGDLPPYHQWCTCFWYYEETDNSDDVKDLDLDIDELNPLELEVDD